MKKKGYKLIPEEHLRKNIISIRWTPEETNWLKAFSSRQSVTLSKYVRAATFERLRQEGAIVPLEKFE